MTMMSTNVSNRPSRRKTGFYAALVACGVLSACANNDPDHYRLGELDLGNGTPPKPIAVAKSTTGMQEKDCTLDADTVAAALKGKDVVIGVNGCSVHESEAAAKAGLGIKLVGAAAGVSDAVANQRIAGAEEKIAKQGTQQAATGANAAAADISLTVTGTADATTKLVSGPSGPTRSGGAAGGNTAIVGPVYNGSTVKMNQTFDY